MKSSNNSPLSLRIIDALRAGYLDVVSEEVFLSPILTTFTFHLCCSLYIWCFSQDVVLTCPRQTLCLDTKVKSYIYLGHIDSLLCASVSSSVTGGYE